MPFYANPSIHAGTNAVSSLGDGHIINVSWFQAYPTVKTNKIAYHIYYSTIKDNIFTDGIKYVSIDASLEANIIDLTPGQDYWFVIRPVEYDPALFNLSLLPIAYDNLRVYPFSTLRSNITVTDLVIPLLDVIDFPATGVIKIGGELVLYSSVDTINNNLIVESSNISPSNAYLINQNGSYFSSLFSNIGNGTINNLTLVNTNVFSATWRIICVAVDTDIKNNPIPGSERFMAFGSNGDRGVLDSRGNPMIWLADNTVRSNGVLLFSISEGTSSFVANDAFIVEVGGVVQSSLINGRGYNNTIARSHDISGFDGINQYDPTVSVYTVGESTLFDRSFVCQSRFEYPNNPWTLIDGYRQVTKDLLSTDLAASDAANVGFPMYDFAGYHRTDPVQLLNGTCVGSYLGGERRCLDGYGNVNILRGFSLQDQNTQRQEVLLSVTGRPAVLIKRSRTGIVCSCYQASSEYPDDRCPLCLGSHFVMGWEQYFNPRRSDGRIMVRADPTDEMSGKMVEAGLESEFPAGLWTLTVPTIKTRDIIVLFDIHDNEEFRYEVTTVNRNNTILGQQGGQHFKVMRIRKFDPAYQIKAFRNTEMFPRDIVTGIGMAIPGLPPHTHTIRGNEKDPSQWSQMTSISQGHNHAVILLNGVLTVMTALGHTHKIM